MYDGAEMGLGLQVNGGGSEGRDQVEHSVMVLCDGSQEVSSNKRSRAA